MGVVNLSNPRASNYGREVDGMYEWTFSATAEWVVGALLLAVIVAMLFV